MCSMVGRTYRLRDSYEVGREKVREFARAVQNEHPAHTDERAAADYGCTGLIAPPTFAALLGGTAQTALADKLTGCDLTTAVHTNQVLDYYRPIVVGDRLTSNISLHSHREAFGGDLMVVSNRVTDQRGEIVLAGHTTLVARTGETELGRRLTELNATILRHDVLTAPPPEVDEIATVGANSIAAHSIRVRGVARDRVSVGDVLPARRYRLTHGDLVQYAGVSGDPNPIHWHRPVAELVGLGPGVVAHGMLTMSLGAGYLTSWVRDPRALRQYSVRMTSPVFVTADSPATVEFGGKIIALHRNSGVATVSLTATQGGRRIFGRATATVALS
ncbi:MaoC family dehydratase N-terminal domain-containing protein [Nocardia huaxiensis]|uniref:MaoC family dehydratase N-terminal domain-containing protein n=2 Tax=Nocardia huaxiensis TaxID=2755382 RepID=A0A7D6ZM68_9NOCA|nr:MaoC family dehydratase N-terminal domain-containing protein [Nocardia huaxiensis]